MQLLFGCQQEVGNYLNGHPVEGQRKTDIRRIHQLRGTEDCPSQEKPSPLSKLAIRIKWVDFGDGGTRDTQGTTDGLTAWLA